MDNMFIFKPHTEIAAVHRIGSQTGDEYEDCVIVDMFPVTGPAGHREVVAVAVKTKTGSIFEDGIRNFKVNSKNLNHHIMDRTEEVY